MNRQTSSQALLQQLVSAPASGGTLQRKCGCGNLAASGECEACKKKKLKLQRFASDNRGGSVAPPIVHDVLRAPGQPLDAAARAFFEARFAQEFGQAALRGATVAAVSDLMVDSPGSLHEVQADHAADRIMRGASRGASRTGGAAAAHDFSRVRIHTDSRAAQSARAVNARAYTVGRDIVFADGEYAPGTHAGRRLLAHELVHAVQQSSSSPARVQRTIGDGHDLRAPRFAGDPVLEACFDDERYLQFGSRGPAVEKLQQAVVDAGFPLPVFGVDGIFESETQTAVKNYQRAHGLEPDGIVGPLTMGALDAQFAGGAPAPAPAPGPAPAPAESITSETVVTQPSPRTRTDIGVGEEVKLTHAPGTAAWTATAGTLSAANGVNVILTAPDTAQRVTVRAGSASINLDVIAPTSVAMDREPGTGVKHTLSQPDSGIQTRVFLGPDNVNFNKARYRELDVAGAGTGVYSCNPASGGHCGAGGGGAACPDKALTTTVVAGMGTQSALGDCAYSGHCGTAPPFAAGSITLSIPYEYKVGTGAFRRFATVAQLHTLAADASTLTTSKAGASGSTTVAAATVTIAQCP